MGLTRIDILDGRGVPRTVPHPDYTVLGGSYRDPRGLRLQEVRAAAYGRRSTSRGQLVQAVLFGGFVFGFVCWAGARAVGPPDAWGMVPVAALLGLAGTWGLYRVQLQPVAADALIAELRACRMCLSCGYDLAGLPAETDDCVVCPECSGAWRIGNPEQPRFTR